MQKPILDKSILGKWLGDIISTEMQKSDDEINWDLVDECEAYLAELYSDVEISEEHMIENIAKIKNKFCDTKSSHQTRRTPRKRRIIAIICAAAMIICGTVSAYAFVPSFRDMINSMIGLSEGSSIEDNGITFTYVGRMTIYKNMDELVQCEKLNIMYPHKLPDGIEIKYVTCASEDENFRCTISFTNNLGSIITEASETDISKLAAVSTAYENSNGITYYITSKDEIYVAITVYNGWTYNISSNNEEYLIELLENIY